MTPGKTYLQLYWDKEFIEKRVKEQKEYLQEASMRWYREEISPERMDEIYDSTNHVTDRLSRQLENINKLE